MGISRGHSSRSLKKSVDWYLVIVYLILVFIGFMNIYASIHSSEPSSVFDFSFRSGKQFVWILTSIFLAVMILFVVNPRLYETASVPIYLFVILLLVAVIFLGVEVKGSRSWFAFGPIRFQPAEISKISTSLLLAAVMSRQGYRITRPRDFIITAFIILLPMLIIVGQSETGSALVYVGFIFALYREGLPGWWLTALGMAILLFILTLTSSAYTSIIVLILIVTFCNSINEGELKKWLMINLPVLTALAFLPMGYEKLAEVVSEGSFIHKIRPLYILIGISLLSMPYFVYQAYRKRSRFQNIAVLSVLAGILLVFSADFVFNNILQDHQRKRIEVLLGLKEDPMGVGYNVNQSKIAIGSGGMFGKGYLGGTQTTYGFVPEQSTDFIFCTVGEEWGFAGCLVVILLYIFLIWRIIHDAEQCRESFTRIYGYCVSCCIFMHLFINVGMTIGLMPVIGIPLPFVSYGGSSLWAFTILLFIFIALYRNEKKYF